MEIVEIVISFKQNNSILKISKQGVVESNRRVTDIQYDIIEFILLCNVNHTERESLLGVALFLQQSMDNRNFDIIKDIVINRGYAKIIIQKYSK